MQIFIDAHPKCRGEELHAANWKPPTPPKEITRDSVEGFGWEVRGGLSIYYSVFSSRHSEPVRLRARESVEREAQLKHDPLCG